MRCKTNECKNDTKSGYCGECESAFKKQTRMIEFEARVPGTYIITDYPGNTTLEFDNGIVTSYVEYGPMQGFITFRQAWDAQQEYVLKQMQQRSNKLDPLLFNRAYVSEDKKCSVCGQVSRIPGHNLCMGCEEAARLRKTEAVKKELDEIRYLPPELLKKYPGHDPVNHPAHYTKGIECIDYITSKGMDFCQGNVIKYVTRYKDKNGLEDLKKAAWYLQRLIEQEGGGK